MKFRSINCLFLVFTLAACGLQLSTPPETETANGANLPVAVVVPEYLQIRPVSLESSKSNSASATLDGQTYYFAREAPLNLSDFAPASVTCERGSIPEDPRWIVWLETSAEGRTRLLEFTRANVGKQIGVFVDGRLISTPVLQTEIDTTIIIDGGYSESMARTVAARIGRGGAP
jgi:preprotein translocase subunit SecD